jgi:uncharacterized protein YdeI (YjbR/CyaY-like superfamily)
MKFTGTLVPHGKTATGISVPDEIVEALGADPKASATFDGLSYTHRKEWVRWVEEAKKPETRAARLVKTVESLREGKKARLSKRALVLPPCHR